MPGKSGTRGRILRLASTLYSTHGCDATTLDDILTAGGITKGAFYHHFKSKEQLCEKIIDQLTNDYEELMGSVSRNADPIDRLRLIVYKLDELHTSGKWVNCRLIFRLYTGTHKSNPQIQYKLSQFWQWYTNEFRELLVECRQAGQLTEEISLETQLELILATMAGAVTLDQVEPTPHGFAHLVDTVLSAMSVEPVVM
ncbi:HTH-type transcriptional repressor KstR2 [Anaerohalosphaera lusitana]|uniref:HTH-type transcriptional repressor KstR2 n=1 Tax=Anaerohalosphaera lusitana TaxID=1936003 RepID=A0A1U9NNE0_9BACT|nr:TetR/AcrR family transcriptional regulator [Anaerohalosphaera lusitana]AQT69345.1 HTH-type transcriptional repressor KstR2 [Anaerohalosphaera lusitana]